MNKDKDIGNDDMVVPMHGQDKIIDFNTVDDKTYQLGDPEAEEIKKHLKHPRITTLPISQRTCAEKLVPYTGEEIPCLMFSNKWQQREEGVKRFSDLMSIMFQNAKEVEKQELQEKRDDDAADKSIQGLTHEQRCNQAILQSMGEILKDKVHQVLVKAFNMLDAYIEYINSNKQINLKQDMSILEGFLFNLLDKLTDTKVLHKVQMTYDKLFRVTQLDCPYLIAFLFKGQQSANK